MGTQKRIEDLSDKDLDRDDDGGARKASAKKSSSSKRRPPTTVKAENELRTRLTECFERISLALEAREDDELADIFREDADVMANGLVFMTRPVAILRLPLLFLVAVVEPALAFGRILRVLAGRFAERRAGVALARQEAQEEAARQAEFATQ